MEKKAALEVMPGCRVKHYAKKDAPGTCGARYVCQQLYDGEDFVLHTDAHMRFARFWDVAMISQWQKCHNEKAVLADYAYHISKADMALPVDDPSFTTRATMECGVVNALFFESNSPELRMHVPHIYHISEPVLGAFVCAHCMFGRPLIDKVVPVDPNMDFVADESSVAVRLWTHGFDIWHAGVRCIYHAYDTDASAPHGHDTSVAMVEGGITRQERQRRRLEKLFGVYDRQDVDLSGFDLGKERSLQTYQEFCGVDFRNMTIRKFAAEGTFGCEHDDSEMEFVDWTAAFEKDQGRPFPDQGVKLDVKVRPDAADDFLGFCKAVGVHPQAALTEAVRQWTDGRRRGRFC